jgi:hypothetical protein
MNLNTYLRNTRYIKKAPGITRWYLNGLRYACKVSWGADINLGVHACQVGTGSTASLLCHRCLIADVSERVGGMSQSEQRANIKFMFKRGKSATETLQVLQKVYGDDALKKTVVYEWFNQFKNGQETLEDEPRTGRPSTS